MKATRLKLLFCLTLIWVCNTVALAESSFERGKQLYAQKQYKPALDQFIHAVTESPSASAYFYCATCFYQLGNAPSARQTYLTVIKYFPQSDEATQARAFLKQLDQAQSAALPAASGVAAKASGVSTSTGASTVDTRPVDCRDLLQIVRPQKDHPGVTTDLQDEIRNKLAVMPHDVGVLLHENHIIVRLATTVIDARPDLANQEGRGYEGATLKSCPGMFTGRDIVLGQRTINEGDESLRSPHSDKEVLCTFQHECGHAVDFCLGEISATDEYKHQYLLDCGNLSRNSPEMANELRYFMQKAEAGQQECCGELIGVLLGKDDERGSDMRKSFPLTLKFLQNRLHM